MAAPLNKKVLCFVDEYGTAGADDLYIGAVLVGARHAGRLDKRLSDLLEPTANEIHAARLNDRYLQRLLLRFAIASSQIPAIYINRKHGLGAGPPPVIYAQALIETVKVGMKRFRSDVLRRSRIGNVEVIADVNHYNETPEFNHEIERARGESGTFRGVIRVSLIDSAASRLLQLADAVAHSRKWTVTDQFNAASLRERFRIQVL